MTEPKTSARARIHQLYTQARRSALNSLDRLFVLAREQAGVGLRVIGQSRR